MKERKKKGRRGIVERKGGGGERERKGGREREWEKEVEGGRERRNETEGEARRWRVGFWNVAGLTNKGEGLERDQEMGGSGDGGIVGGWERVE